MRKAFVKTIAQCLVSTRCSVKTRLNNERKGSVKGKERDKTVAEASPDRVPNPTMVEKLASLVDMNE